MFVSVVLAGCAGLAHATSPMLQELEQAFINISDQVRPCVVNIDTEQKPSADSDDPRMKGLEDLFREFGWQVPDGHDMRPRRFRAVASGSGFILDKQGHVVTANHVIENAKTITVRLANGKIYDAKVIGADADTDLAVIQIQAEGDLPVAVLGDSDALKVGQFAVAVGSPRGFEGSVSFGHVSALGREGLGLPNIRFQNFIQTDAAINLGNSGGPLCDIDGNVIGVNNSIVAGAESLGFAIPINTAKTIVPQLIDKGKVTRGFLGVDISDVSDAAKRAGANKVEDFLEVFGLSDAKGAFVVEALSNSPAERAGIKSDDVIRKLNGQDIQDSKDLVLKVSALEPGSSIHLDVWRNKAPLGVDVQIAEYAGNVTKARLGGAILGMLLRPVTPDRAQSLGLEEGVKGLEVIDVEEDSPAEQADINPGDVIVEVAQQPVTSLSEFRDLLKQNAQPGKSVLLRITRQGERPMPKLIKVPEAGIPGL
jgi:Do/DeqQ family serine protease